MDFPIRLAPRVLFGPAAARGYSGIGGFTEMLIVEHEPPSDLNPTPDKRLLKRFGSPILAARPHYFPPTWCYLDHHRRSLCRIGREPNRDVGIGV